VAAASSAAAASSFARKHGVPASCGGYAELVARADVDVVYVGNVHVFRRSVGELAIRAGKHVLLEKPAACSAEDARYLRRLAGERGVFLAEGMWTRYFPAVEHARRLIADEEIGEVVAVNSDFHFNTADSEAYPASPLFDRKLAGGASFYCAPYPIAAALMCFPQAFPEEEFGAAGTKDDRTGVDLQGSVSLTFPGPGGAAPAGGGAGAAPALGGRGVASLSFGFVAESAEETVILGTGGRITLHSPAHCPTRLTVVRKREGRGRGEEEVLEFPLPEITAEVKAAGGFYYPNSAGLAYEAAAVARVIKAGGLSSPQYTFEETVEVLRIVEGFRERVGVKTPFEPGDAEPGDAEPGDAEPGGPGDAGPGDAQGEEGGGGSKAKEQLETALEFAKKEGGGGGGGGRRGAAR
jgi:dihydrodiol dehydrogenase / D-xylose 1-dehydrogenase (NADP)